MKRIIVTVLIAVATTVSAQQQPSAKVTAQTSSLNIIPKTKTTTGWQTILANQIKTSNQKDLIINVSLECGLWTQTLSTSKALTPDASSAQAVIEAQVLIDGVPIDPGAVTFAKRTQTLTAKLEGAIGNALTIVTNVDGSLSIVVNPDLVAPETIELIQDSMQACSFVFVAVDVPQGVHWIAVQARIDSTGYAKDGVWAAEGAIGRGTMTAESVRMIKGEDAIVPEL